MAYFNINDHEADPYLVDFTERRNAGKVNAHDRANQALATADLAACIIGEQGDDLDKAQALAVTERVALAASMAAKAVRLGEDALADRFADQAKSEALVLSSFDYVNVN